MADYSDPKRATAFRFTMSLFARSDNQIKTAPTLAAGDVKVSKDNGATANITTLPAETPASSGILQVDLSATEMTADLVTIIFRDAAGAEWNDVAVNIAPSTVQMADLATAAALTTVDDLLDTEVAAIKTVVDAILVDTAEIGAAGAGLTVLATQASVNTIDDFLDTEVAAILAAVDTEVATIVSQTTAANIRAAVGLASANLDTQIGTLATAANLSTVAGYLDTEIAAILADTNELQADWADGGRLDLLIDAINAKTTNLPSDPADASVIAGRFDTLDTSVADLPTNAELATALGDIPSAAAIADAVWDEALAGHAGAGSTGEQLAAAGAAGDPWATALPGAYSAGSAGKIVGDALDAAVSTRASQATLDTLDGVADAIKVKTDSLTFTVAGQVDANIQYVNDVQVTGTGASGDEWGP